MFILRLALAQHWLRSHPPSRDILRSLGVASGMEDTGPNLLSVHPDKLLSFVQPFHLEFLLADGTDAVCERRVVGHREVLEFGV